MNRIVFVFLVPLALLSARIDDSKLSQMSEILRNLENFKEVEIINNLNIFRSSKLILSSILNAKTALFLNVDQNNKVSKSRWVRVGRNINAELRLLKIEKNCVVLENLSGEKSRICLEKDKITNPLIKITNQ